MRKVAKLLPKDASVAPLVAQAAERGLPVSAGSAGAIGISASDGPGLTVAQTKAFLTAALSRVGLPYVWGGAGPNVFDCSGLVQWSMRQAGIVMPRVAVDQAQTGPRIPLADLQPGDLLFYHTDPTAPTYISHVAIYLGNGLMLQAPEPGEDVQIVPADLRRRVRWRGPRLPARGRGRRREPRRLTVGRSRSSFVASLATALVCCDVAVATF